MTTHFPGLNTFDRRSLELDVDYTFAWVKHSPSVLSDELMDRIKFCARNLKKTTGIQQTKALEGLASALSFSSWHDLNSQLSKAGTLGAEGASEQWVFRFLPALVLTIEPKPEIPLGAEQASALESFASSLADATGQTKQVILDGVVAKLCGALTWKDIKSRSPLTAKAPLYRFIVDGHDPQDSRFVTSAACEALTEQMYSLHPSFQAIGDEERARICTWLRNVLESQPLFLEGGLKLGSLLNEAEDPSARAVVERHLAQVNALIPKGFRGKILWGWQVNRFYHRLMFLLLEILNREADTYGEMQKAIKLARKMLRLNPTDNLGVRYLLPLLLLQVDNADGAAKASGILKSDEGGDALLIKSFCSFANGDLTAFRDQLVGALFEVPAWRLFLMDELEELTDGDDGYRGYVPAMATLASFAWPAYRHVENLERACRSLLKNSLVIQAEAELRQLWLELPSGPSQERFEAVLKYQRQLSRWKQAIAEGVSLQSFL